MLEFTVMAPVIALIGLMSVQWILAFHTRQQLQHAGFLAARAGAQAQAQPEAIEAAHLRALVPLYGGGRTERELEETLERVRADLAGHLRIQVLNPTAESFDDWSDPALQARLGAPRRVIPNDGLALLSPQRAAAVGERSGQTLADANQLQLRITTGVPLRVPLAGPLVRQVLQWTDRGSDAFVSELIAAGRLPSTVDVRVRMQSPAMESVASPPGAERFALRPPAHPAGSGSLPTACSTLGCANGSTLAASRPPSTAPAAPTGAGTGLLNGAGSAVPPALPETDPLFCPLPG